MIDPMTAAELTEKLYKLHQRLKERKTRAFETARDELFRDWLVELKLALDDVRREAERTKVESTVVGVRVNEPTYFRAAEILAAAANAEPLQERRRMLAYAAATWPILSLSTSDFSRALRIVLELDPEDLKVLYQLSQLGNQDIPGDVFAPSQDGAKRHERLSEHGRSEAVLLAHGCVLPRYTTGTNNLGPEIHITAIGRVLLEALSVYIRTCEIDPGFATRPLKELARTLPEDDPDRRRLLDYDNLVETFQAARGQVDEAG